ncbi:MAG: S9 family peptidase [Pseudomonadota bacterium]|nr:S9 family peptidase [Pseudomonadota bacterium]
MLKIHAALRTVVTVLCCIITSGAGQAATTAPHPLVPIGYFFDNPTFSGAVLSPNAKFLATRIGRAGQRDALAVIDLTNHAAKVVASLAGADVGEFSWVNDNRLVFDATDKRIGEGDRRYGGGLFAVDRDGSNSRQLVLREDNAVFEHSLVKMLPANTYLVEQQGPRNTPFVYVGTTHLTGADDLAAINLQRLDTLSGRVTAVGRPGQVQEWLLDQQGEPRLVTTLDRNLAALLYRDPTTDKWRKLAEFDAYIGGKDAIEPVGFGPDGTLYVSSSDGHDKTALYRFDLASGKRDPAPMIELEGYDFTGSMVIANGKLLGVRILTDARSTIWFDDAMKATQQRIDALLPGTVNLVSVAQRAETPWLLVLSYSDTVAGSWNLFNTETGKLNKVGDSHAGIVPAQMGQQEAVRYKARDGLEIPAWLTLPHGSNRKNLPLVVLVHGGPYVRGAEWGWKADVQFLASRGYAVLEPEFRGSTGYGNKHYRAGWKQWGLAMQNDIADAAKWAIAEGIVDPQRICIAGASYGGYATLMGLINDPTLFKCGIDWVGVTDIGLLANGHWSMHSDLSDGYKQYGMPELVGDVVKDAAQFKATSPLQQAARITQPLLLAYGGADVRVPVYHGRKFYDAVRLTNPNVEMVVYEEEGHGWTLPKNRIDFWSRVEKFLDKAIGKP